MFLFNKILIIFPFTGKVWNAVSGEEVHSFQHKHIVKSVAFNESSENLVTGSNEKLIRVFNLQQPNAGNNVIFLIFLIRRKRVSN